MNTAPDIGYTAADHESRDQDKYAEAKYLLTVKWLRARRVGHAEPILNVGAGAGDFHLIASQAGFQNVTGIEPDPHALSLAKRRAPDGHRFLAAGIFDDSVPVSNRAIVMHDVLEHIEDDAEATDRLADLLDNDTMNTLVISVPAWPILFGYHDEMLGHYRRYTPSSLRKRMEPRFQILYMRQLGLLGVPAAAYYSRLQGKPYPVGDGGWADRVVNITSRVEQRFVPPIGTSLLAVARPRRLR